MKPNHTPHRFSLLRGRFARVLILLLLVVVGFLVWPAKPVNIREFHPEELALREASAWRAYYEERYATLFWQVFKISHQEFGFSLRDSLRMAYHAARAASHFRRSNKPEDIARAQTDIEQYYRIISRANQRAFDYKQAAALELEWWQMRRKKLPQEEWANTISRQCEIVYGPPMADFLPSVRLRVAAMVDRDSKRKTTMTDEDWLKIEGTLLESAALFWEVLHPSPVTEAVTAKPER